MLFTSKIGVGSYADISRGLGSAIDRSPCLSMQGTPREALKEAIPLP